MRRAYIIDTKDPRENIRVEERTEPDTIEVSIIGEGGDRFSVVLLTRKQFMELSDLQWKVSFEQTEGKGEE